MKFHYFYNNTQRPQNKTNDKRGFLCTLTTIHQVQILYIPEVLFPLVLVRETGQRREWYEDTGWRVFFIFEQWIGSTRI